MKTLIITLTLILSALATLHVRAGWLEDLGEWVSRIPSDYPTTRATWTDANANILTGYIDIERSRRARTVVFVMDDETIKHVDQGTLSAESQKIINALGAMEIECPIVKKVGGSYRYFLTIRKPHGPEWNGMVKIGLQSDLSTFENLADYTLNMAPGLAAGQGYADSALAPDPRIHAEYVIHTMIVTFVTHHGEMVALLRIPVPSEVGENLASY